MHTDASHVTLNVCLGKNFTGAKLTFCGIMGKNDHRQFRFQYEHVKGQCLIHLGNQRHGACDIETGERVNLIMWNGRYNFFFPRSFIILILRYSDYFGDYGRTLLNIAFRL